MKQIKWDMLGLAILAAAGLSGIGMAIGAHSIIGVVASIAVLVLAMREGFKRKKNAAKKH